MHRDIGRRAQIPDWFYFTPFGQPRGIDVTNIRSLASQPWIEACVSTLTDKFAGLEWEIVAKDKKNFSKGHIDEITNFLNKPNLNGESESSIRRKWARDLLQLDAGVLTKVFSDGSYEQPIYKSIEKKVYYKKGLNKGSIYKKQKIKKEFRPLKPLGKRELVEIYASDSGTFQKDTDQTGFIKRYFQYSFKIPRKDPLIFDRNEVSYTMRYPRSNSVYGWSVVQSIEQIVLTLKSQVQYFLGFFRERGIPDGILSIMDTNKAELKRLAEFWKKNTIGRKHKFGIIGRDVKFTPLTITSRDMEILSTQQWFAKMVMAMFHLNIPILSLRGEAPKAGLESLSKSEVMDALRPIMQEWTRVMNNDIIPEKLGLEQKKVDIEFRFKVYDLEEDERKRAMQREDIKTGVLTVNEVRVEERGLDPVEWGDTPMNFMMPFGNPKEEEKEGED